MPLEKLRQLKSCSRRNLLLWRHRLRWKESRSVAPCRMGSPAGRGGWRWRIGITDSVDGVAEGEIIVDLLGDGDAVSCVFAAFECLQESPDSIWSLASTSCSRLGHWDVGVLGMREFVAVRITFFSSLPRSRCHTTRSKCGWASTSPDKFPQKKWVNHKDDGDCSLWGYYQILREFV